MSAGPAGQSEGNGHDSAVANALGEYLDVLARGQQVDIGEFCARYPQIEGELREQIAEFERLDSSPGNVALPPGTGEEIPETLSGHRVLEPAGKGAMGCVLVAYDDRLGRKVAIKLLGAPYRGNPQLRERFMQEARAMARLSHPNVAAIYSLGPDNEEPHFVMEYVEGRPLTDFANLDLTQKVELMRKVAVAVEFLHRNGILHRDLKPGNILVNAQLEPKVLDFGLALRVDDASRLTAAGDVLGTPAYFSPEQTHGTRQLDARSDVFSLGAVFYELLTGALPFPADSLAEQMREIREHDPPLPRRLNSSIPGEIQNVCLKALEKDPASRYASAREFADDLARFLSGEPVIAQPTAYSRLMAGRIQQHVRELQAWRKDHVLSDFEFEAFRKLYDRLIEREDAWIMEMRRLSLAQVSLYLGAWLLAVGACLVLLFNYRSLAGVRSVGTVGAATVLTCWLGVRSWVQGRTRTAIGFLLAFCLLLPVAGLVTMTEMKLFSGFTGNKEDLELSSFLPSDFKRITNAQLWWALLLSLPAYYWLRRFTRASVFSLVFSFMTMMLCLVTLARLHALEWVNGVFYFRLLPFAALFFAAGILLEHFGYAIDSRYVYPFAVGFTFVGLSGVAARYKPIADWIEAAFPFTRGQIEYLFFANAGIYVALQYFSDRFPLPQMRNVAKAFRFVIPGHVLTTLLLLGLSASEYWEQGHDQFARHVEARALEVILPLVAALFVFASVSRQAKNYFVSGLLFLAIGLVRLQQDWVKQRGFWPVSLLAIGMVLMLVASNYSAVRLAFRRKTGSLTRDGG